MKHKTD